MYIDSHAHLYMLVKERDIDINSIFKDMLSCGVSCVTNISGNEAESRFHLEHLVPAAEKNGISLFHSAGIHPHTASEFSCKDIEWLKEISSFTDAIGEVGMDLHYSFSPENKQADTLLKMIDLGIELKKPLIIHGRDAEEKIIEILKNRNMVGRKVLFHCFTGDQKVAEKIIENGWFISFSGIVTFKKAEEIVSVLKNIDLKRVFFETDSPFLAPHPFRGKTNTPAKVKYIYDFAADLLEVDPKSLTETVRNNFETFFGKMN